MTSFDQFIISFYFIKLSENTWVEIVFIKMVLNIGRYPNSKNVKLLNTENQNKKGGVFYNTKKMKMCDFGNMYNN